MVKYFLIVVLVVSLLTGGIVGVANGAGQGNPLSSLDKGLETLRLTMSMGAGQQESFQASSLPERLNEVSDLVRQGLPEDAVDVVDEQVAAEGDLTALESTITPDPWTGPEERYIPISDQYCDGTITDPHPVATRLAEYFGVPYQEIMDWHCAGWGFGEIAVAYTVSQESGVPVADLFSMRESGMGWGEILRELGLLPDHDWQPRPTVTPGTDPNPLPGRNECPNVLENPALKKLAETLGVPVEDVAAWFCKGYGIGEIALAYEISKAAEVPVEDVFALRDSGMGWGEIFKHYNLVNVPGKPERPERPVIPGKPERPARPTLPAIPGRPGRGR